MQLTGLKPGNYTVTAFLSNLMEGEIINTRTVPFFFSITEDVAPSMDIELKSNGENVRRDTLIPNPKDSLLIRGIHFIYLLTSDLWHPCYHQYPQHIMMFAMDRSRQM